MSSEGTGDSGIIEAAGGILSRPASKGKQIALIYRSRYDDWTLPKGKRYTDETYLEAAKREVKEETNCLAETNGFVGCVCYQVNEVPKIVLFWHMILTNEEPFKPNREVDKLKWVSIKKAIKKLSYRGEKDIVKKYKKGIA